jgi:hypothetical protein
MTWRPGEGDPMPSQIGKNRVSLVASVTRLVGENLSGTHTRVGGLSTGNAMAFTLSTESRRAQVGMFRAVAFDPRKVLTSAQLLPQ